jgi:hypothetical protein
LFDKIYRWVAVKDVKQLPVPSNVNLEIFSANIKIVFDKLPTDLGIRGFEIGIAHQLKADSDPSFYSSYGEIDTLRIISTSLDTFANISTNDLQLYLKYQGLNARDRTVLLRVRYLSDASYSPWSDGFYLFPWQIWNDESLKPKPSPTPTPSESLKKGELTNFDYEVDRDQFVFSFKDLSVYDKNVKYEVGYAYLKSATHSPYLFSSYEEPKVIKLLECKNFRVDIGELMNYLSVRYPKDGEGSLLVRVRATSENFLGDWYGNYFFRKESLQSYLNSVGNKTSSSRLWCG